MPTTPEDIEIECNDGARLAATLYRPEGPARAAIMIAPATGIRRGFYRDFAAWLAREGYGALTFDNRGIGGSRRGPLRACEATLIDWGRLDMTAVLETLRATFPNTTYHLVGHSAGGQLVGLMANAHGLTSMFNFACSSGSLRTMRRSYRVKAEFFMNVFIPVNNAVLGHTHSPWVGMGEPLPRRVAAQWRRWCNGAGYAATDFGHAIPHGTHLYDELALPSQWLYATDDDIANLANVHDMVRVYAKSPSSIVKLEPSARAIGHMGFFKQEPLWAHARAWLAEHAR